jgi:hypothetical protein
MADPVNATPSVTDSILNSIKKLLMIADDDHAFDVDLIIHTNTFLQRLRQIGVGDPSFQLTNETQTWKDFLTDVSKFAQAKTYVYMRVRLLFDPPSNASVIKSYEENIRELEWLLNVDAEHVEPEDGE